MPRTPCTSCDGSGDGPGKDRYSEPNPCPACDGTGYVGKDVDPKRTAWMHGEERSTVHYAICGKSATDCTVHLCPTYGGDSYLPDLTLARKIPEFKCIAHFTPFSPGTRTHITVTVPDGGWIDLHVDEAIKLNERIIRYREEGT